MIIGIIWAGYSSRKRFTFSSRSLVAPWILAFMAVLLLPSIPLLWAQTGKITLNVLTTPAMKSPLATKTALQSLAYKEGRAIAVGWRGHILVSNDHGKTWTQASVPVSSDLTAVWMSDKNHAWATGHDGVVLHSNNGGLDWTLQMDGRLGAKLIVDDLQSKISASPADKTLQKQWEEAKFYQEGGPDRPLLGVWFADNQRGFVVGSYNLIYHTTDGGATWQSWFDRTDNPDFFHFNAIHGNEEQVVIAGEQGMVLSLNPANQRFEKISTTYNGSFFNLATHLDTLMVVGMRGNVWRSGDAGATWEKSRALIQSGITDIHRLADGEWLATSQGGALLKSTDDGRTFSMIPGLPAIPYTAVRAVGDTGDILLTSLRGIQVLTLPEVRSKP
jgi:photosystem II stability/assembly factor-like uncharacterized protein